MWTLAIFAFLSANPLQVGDIYDGHCVYPPELGPAGPTETRASCDSVLVTAQGQPITLMVQFVSRAGSLIGFAGDVDRSGTMSVRRIYLRPAIASTATRGHCRVFRNENDDLSGISCVGFIGPRVYMANFRAFAP